MLEGGAGREMLYGGDGAGIAYARDRWADGLFGGWGGILRCWMTWRTAGRGVRGWRDRLGWAAEAARGSGRPKMAD